MPSPFPGMNPYLEQPRVWHDFHERFLPAIADHLAGQADPRYVVKIDEHVFIHEIDGGGSALLGRADVSVARQGKRSGRDASLAVLEAPCEVLLPDVDVERLSYVEIRDRDSWTLVTVIELLSPSNKQIGKDREQFVSKRSQLLSSRVHYVEIDLLRGDPRLPFDDLPDCEYYALVSRCEDRPRGSLWPVRLRDPLPVIPVPLYSPSADLSLDLQFLLHRVYDSARYQNWIYTRGPIPPLSADDAFWSRQILEQVLV